MNRHISYTFELENGSRWEYQLEFDEAHHYVSPNDSVVRDWTKLEFNKCPHCPLKADKSPQCPVAKNLDRVVEDSKSTLSFTRAKVTVSTKERSYSKECATQEGLRSLFGLLMASSGCPHLDWLRPLARFHLPFGDIDESLFRILSLQLLEAFLSGKGGSMQDCAKEIEVRYRNVEKVNHTFKKRIRDHCQQDADKNAIAALDVFVQMFNFQAESNFSSLRKYFSEAVTKG